MASPLNTLILTQSNAEINILFIAMPALMLVLVAVLIDALPRTWKHMFPGDNANRNYTMDGARGLLSLWVLTHHLNVLTVFHQPNAAWLPGVGPVSALMASNFFTAPFFAMTGMLFGGSLLASKGKIDPLPFLRNRFFRLFPAYMLSLLLVYLAAFYMTDFHRSVSWVKLAKEAIRWSSFGMLNRYTVNGVDLSWWHGMLWTLPFEISFYCLLPFLAYFQRKSGTPLVVIGALALVGLSFWQFLFFAAGTTAAAGLAWRHRLAPRVWSVASVGSIAIIALTAKYSNSVVQAILLVPILVAIAQQNALFSPLRWKPLRFTGEISYSIYILHFPMICILYNLILDHRSINAMDFYPRILLLSLFGFGIIIMSAYSFIFIERPFNAFGKRSGQHVATMRSVVARWAVATRSN